MTLGPASAPLRAPLEAVQFPSPLPIADAARLAWPDLNSRIERLRIERIAVSAGEPGVCDGAPLLAPQMRHADLGMRDAFRARALARPSPRSQPARIARQAQAASAKAPPGKGRARGTGRDGTHPRQPSRSTPRASCRGWR